MLDILIVGAGPAGSAAAIEIANIGLSLAPRVLVIDQATFPRPKLCGGGVTADADKQLAALGVRIDIPSIPIRHMQMRLGARVWHWRGENLFRVVRREEFDYALVKEARARGITVHEGQALVELAPDVGDNTLIVRTGRDEYRARIVIGADGANSVVRQKIGLARWDRISRLIEILTPVDAARAPEFRNNTAVFDFTPLLDGVQGYYWDFPSVKNGEAQMNRGVFDSRVRPERSRADLKSAFAERLHTRGVEINGTKLAGHPERWFDPYAKHSTRRVLLAGDAAGAEPLLGEGISYALEFGRFAARYALAALEQNEFAFDDYEEKIRASSMGKWLNIKRRVARYVYSDKPRWFYEWGWRFASQVLR